MTSSRMSRQRGTPPSPAATLRLRGHTAPVQAGVHWPAPASRAAGRTAAAPPLVFFGGGAVARGPNPADAVCRTLSSVAGVVVVSVPDMVSTPDAFRDAAAVVEWVADHGAELAADPDRLLVAGQGAGCRLATSVTLHARDHGWPPLLRQILIFPDLSPRPADGGSRDVAAALPLPSMAGVAPAAVLTGCGGGFRRDDGRRFSARLRHAGVPVQELRYGPAHGSGSRSDTASGAVTERVLDLAGAVLRALSRAPPVPRRARRSRPSPPHVTTKPPEGGTTVATTLISQDGTTIAYEVAGSGPALILVNTTAEDRTALAGLAEALAEDFTVVRYDRRGRGGSGDPQPYDPAREIDDLDALIDVVGGSAALVSGSAGAVLALDAATALGPKAVGLHLYEPPFIVDDSRPPVPADYVAHQDALVAAGRREEAVEYFFTRALLIPADWLEGFKQDPTWDAQVGLAHTYAYDGRIVDGLQAGKPLPTDRWDTDAPVLVLVGGDSEPYFRDGADALTDVLPNVIVETLPGQDHAAFWTAPDTVAASIRTFLGR